MKTIKINNWTEIPNNFTGIAVSAFGTYWYKEGNHHREDGITKQWWLEDENYKQINLKDYIVLDHYQGKHNLMWYKLLDKDKIIDHPDIPGLITK